MAPLSLSFNGAEFVPFARNARGSTLDRRDEFILCLADSIPFGNNLTTRSCCIEEQRASIKQALDDRHGAARVIFIAHGVVCSWDFSTTKKEEELTFADTWYCYVRSAT